MSNILDAFPYPFHFREAQELHATLCQIYPTAKGALFVAARVGLDTGMIFGDQAPYFVWKEVLEAAASASKTRMLVRLVRDHNPNNPRIPFLDALQASVSPVVDLDPRDSSGAPTFVLGDDQISEPEALLFHDDLTLPIGRVPWLIDVLGRLHQLAPAVCRLEVAGYGAVQRGTAFRIGSNLLLTNWHVLFVNGGAATTVTAEFGYEDDGKGGFAKAAAIPCDTASIRGDQKDDWCVVRTAEPLGERIPMLRLSNSTAPILNAPAFVIQHPGGERKRLAYVRNQITRFDDRVVQYLSDTQGGSSGSPVLDENAKIIALHHAGGRPQEVAGKAPLKKNEGIRISRVRIGLESVGIAVD